MSSVTMYEMKQMEEQKKNATVWNRAYKQGQKDVLDQVLEILDRYYLWHYEKSIGEYVTIGKEIEEKIKALKGGEQE